MKIIIRNFQKKIPVNPKRIKKAILNVLSQEGIKKSGEITVCFINDRRIKQFNARYLGKNESTDVLVFDLLESKDADNKIFADILVSTDTAISNAAFFQTTLSYELNLYVIHGTLHLLGYDDSTPRQKKVMRQKEKEYVNTQD